MKRTKIVCTIGPASEKKEVLSQLVEEGMNVARLNFSHGDFEEHAARIKTIREIAEETGKVIAVLLDTKGPEIRTHDMTDGKLEFETGDVVRVAMNEVLGTKERFSITYPQLIEDVEVGSSILLDDGLIGLEVTDIDLENQDIVTVVKNSGILKNKKGVNVPGVSTNLPGITEKDKNDIIFGIEQDVDYIAASFVRRPSDVQEIKELLAAHNAEHIQIIPKIENQEGIDNIDEILALADGLMIARGDMGVEIPAEEVPIVQKSLIAKCNALGKPVITATQMLDSMQRNPRPTRAEAGDVANAIFDGTDAVMLSGESAAGDYPVEAVRTMANICTRTERELKPNERFKLETSDASDVAEAIARSVAHTAKNLNVKTIIAATESGHTAKMIAKFRPNADILTLTFKPRSARGLALVSGVHPIVVEKLPSTDAIFECAQEEALKHGFGKEGDLTIVTAGVPIGKKGSTNMMKVQSL
ncbi:pyruvate kinase [Granulicatella balaenopterae]|uniref:Pyruvate kinase n=1 Tax=Granulicatella balaenopterae TaxID=137733 RepID=A0A1H9HUN5_9LACT|nr:pyruvate kinase [Granulicatella balaenopterae]